jgi:tetratricopeptide (TPR) repeat protein
LPSQPPPTPQAAEEQQERRRRAERHFRRGWVLQEQGDLERAHEEYTAAVAADNTYADAYLERGQVYRFADQFDDAITDFTSAIEHGAGAEAYLRRANSYTEQNRFDRAFADYREALRLDPDFAAAYVNRGLASLKVGEFARAVADADRALRIDPALTRALFVRGAAHGKQEHYELALADFDLLIQLEPDNSLAHNQRGLVHAARGQYDEAVADYTAALRLTPGFEAALFNRGHAHRLRGDGEAAVADFTAFLGHRPQNAQAYYHRGQAHLSRQDHDAAIADFTHAFQLDPNLHKAYTSCLEATRAKYEKPAARTPPPQRPRPATPVPPVKEETASHRAATEATAAEPTAAPAEKQQRKEEAPAAENRGEAGATRPARKPTAAVSKLRVECPECGTEGLLDVRNLDKLFRCPNCQTWWRTSATGDLMRADGPGIEVEVASGTGRNKHRVPGAAGGQSSDAATTAPARETAAGTEKSPPKARPAPKRRRREGSIRYAYLWVTTAAQTRSGRWALAAGVLALLGLVPLLFPSLFPSQLRTRGEKAAQAWLARDVDAVKQFVEPSQTEKVELWLKQEPPPNLAGQEPAPRVTVAVERNDGRNAVVVIQIKAKNKNGAAAFFVFRHRWVSVDGVWYVEPNLRLTRASLPGRNGSATGS